MRTWPMGLHPLSGKDVSLVRAFPGTPLRGRSPLGRPSSGRSGTLSGRSGHGCLHKVTYQGGDGVLEGLFHGLCSQQVASQAHTALSTGPLSRGMAERNSPEAMSSLVLSPGERCDGRGHHDEFRAFSLSSVLFFIESNCLSVWAVAWLRMSRLQMEPSGLDRPL